MTALLPFSTTFSKLRNKVFNASGNRLCFWKNQYHPVPRGQTSETESQISWLIMKKASSAFISNSYILYDNLSPSKFEYHSY